MRLTALFIVLLLGTASSGHAKIRTDERTLVVVSNLSQWAKPKLRSMFRFVEVSFVALALKTVGKKYHRTVVLSGAAATLDRFVQSLGTAGEDSGQKAVDVFLALHGGEDELMFTEGGVQVAEIARRIRELGISDQLRLFYSQACYGALHAPLFVDAGFAVASGSKRVNANGPGDFLTTLRGWSKGWSYRRIIDAVNVPWHVALYDRIARRQGFKDVDSTKEYRGDGNVTITSE